MISLRVMMLIVLLCITSMVDARPIHYGAVVSPQLAKCDDQHWRGQISEAQNCYQALLSNNTALAIQAEAAWALGDKKAASRLFDSASKQSQTDLQRSNVLSRWADLFTNTYQFQDALELYVQASELAEDNQHALLGIGLVLHESSSTDAGEKLASIVENTDHDGVKLKALLTLASIQIRSNKVTQADELLRQAEQIAEREAYPLLEVYATQAANAIRDRSDPTPYIDKALQLNSSYGDAYAIPAYVYMITFKYDQVGEFYQKAVDIQPDHYSAHLQLGANHLRQNRSTLAREHFTIAFDGDSFNPEAVNSMRLMDTYDSFDVVNFKAENTQNSIPDLSLRLDKKERDLLAPYVSDLALNAIDQFEDRYQFKLKETAHIEVYPNHDDFIVRAIGMPGVPLLGVAFGYLVAMDSPTAKKGNDYHWGTTLWHEVAHIFTIKASQHNVPRWFSEGVSVYEEWQTGPLAVESGYARVPLNVYKSLEEHEFLPIADLDNGFSRPQYNNQVIVSYNQAGLICDFIVNEFSFDALVKILQSYAQNLTTVEAIESVLDLTPEKFDQRFQSYFYEKYGDNLANLDDWVLYMEAASKARAADNWNEVIVQTDKAIRLMPNYSDPDSPYLLKAYAYEQLEDTEKQFQTIETFWQAGGYSPAALKELADYYVDNKNTQNAIDVLGAINLVDPFDLDVHLQLGDLLLEQQNAEQALTEFKVAMALDPLDKAAVYFRMGSANKILGDTEEARRQALAALEIAPHFRPAQKLLMETISQ